MGPGRALLGGSAQPPVASFLPDPRGAGGPLETVALPDRVEEPPAHCRTATKMHDQPPLGEALRRSIDPGAPLTAQGWRDRIRPATRPRWPFANLRRPSRESPNQRSPAISRYD